MFSKIGEPCNTKVENPALSFWQAFVWFSILCVGWGQGFDVGHIEDAHALVLLSVG
jgi:hypothetical protein